MKCSRRCGEWCRYCYNAARRWTKRGKYKKMLKSSARKNDVMAAIKNDVKKDAEFRSRFKNCVDECIHLMSGGRARIRNAGETVANSHEVDLEALEGDWKFYKLKRYIKDFGDPKKNRAKVIKHKKYGMGVMVDVADKDVIPMRKYRRDRVSRTKQLHDGNDVYDEGEISEALALAFGAQLISEHSITALSQHSIKPNNNKHSTAARGKWPNNQ